MQAGDVVTLEALFAPGAHLYSSDGATVTDLPRDAWLAQVAARPKQPFVRADAIELVDISGPHHGDWRGFWSSPGRGSCRDYLNFLKVGASWQVIAKIYRPVDRPAA